MVSATFPEITLQIGLLQARMQAIEVKEKQTQLSDDLLSLGYLDGRSNCDAGFQPALLKSYGRLEACITIIVLPKHHLCSYLLAQFRNPGFGSNYMEVEISCIGDIDHTATYVPELLPLAVNYLASLYIQFGHSGRQAQFPRAKRQNKHLN